MMILNRNISLHIRCVHVRPPHTSDQSLPEAGDLLEAVLDQLSIVGSGEEPLELLSAHIPVQGRPQGALLPDPGSESHQLLIELTHMAVFHPVYNDQLVKTGGNIRIF